jgi:hypothetical protein
VSHTATQSDYSGASSYGKETNSVVIASGRTYSVPDVNADLRFGGNTVLDFGRLETVTLTGVALSKLAADDFVFG